MSDSPIYDSMTVVARATDPETSWAAAASVTDLRSKQQAVFSVLRSNPSGLTHEELVIAYHHVLGLPIQSESGIRTRCNELVRLGVVEWTGTKRRNSNGNLARIWRAL